MREEKEEEQHLKEECTHNSVHERRVELRSYNPTKEYHLRVRDVCITSRLEQLSIEEHKLSVVSHVVELWPSILVVSKIAGACSPILAVGPIST